MKFSKNQLKVKELYDNGISINEIQKILKITRCTIYRCLRDKFGVKFKSGKKLIIINENTALCSICNIPKNIDEFQWGRKNKKHSYRFSYCNDCRTRKNYGKSNQNLDCWLSWSYNRHKYSAKSKEKEFTISEEYFKKLFHFQNGCCWITGLKFKTKNIEGVGRQINTLSLDRIDNNIGYIPGNILFLIHKINFVKSNFSLEEMKKWIPDWYNKIQDFLLKIKDVGLDRQLDSEK